MIPLELTTFQARLFLALEHLVLSHQSIRNRISVEFAIFGLISSGLYEINMLTQTLGYLKLYFRDKISTDHHYLSTINAEHFHLREGIGKRRISAYLLLRYHIDRFHEFRSINQLSHLPVKSVEERLYLRYRTPLKKMKENY